MVGTIVTEYIFDFLCGVLCFATCQLHKTKFYCKCFLIISFIFCPLFSPSRILHTRSRHQIFLSPCSVRNSYLNNILHRICLLQCLTVCVVVVVVVVVVTFTFASFPQFRNCVSYCVSYQTVYY
jgi:hypothetical protein